MAIYELDDKKPNLPSKGNYWIAPNASVIGNVTLHEKASVWFNTVIRGDCEPIIIGKKTNIQDNTFESLKIISNDENKLVLSYEKSKLSIDSIISEIKKQDIKIQDISTDDGDLEDVFLRLTKN